MPSTSTESLPLLDYPLEKLLQWVRKQVKEVDQRWASPSVTWEELQGLRGRRAALLEVAQVIEELQDGRFDREVVPPRGY